MLKNYFLIALRNLRRDFLYNIINIVGLTIGIASSVLLLMYVIDDLSYDRFHKNHQNIYRIGSRISEPDEMRGHIFTFFSVLTVLIACLGLFSLAAYTVEQRSREIGIRKVMGATSGRIVRMLLLSYLSLVSFSVILALIAGYYFGSRWLDRFVYKDSLDAEAFVMASIITIVLTFLTVSYHALKASVTNPATVLKDE